MITSTANQQVKEVQKLHKSPKYRSSMGLFVAEGWRLVSEVPKAFVEKVFVIEREMERAGEDFDSACVIPVSAQVMKAMSNETSPQGILALVKMADVEDEPLSVDNPLIVALDCVQDPGNLGTIIRTAEAAGVDQILLSKGTVDLYNPKVVKSTMGAIFRMNILQDVVLEDKLPELSQQGIAIYAAHLRGEQNHYGFDYRVGTCFLMGNEGNGLRDEIAYLATTYLKIPMAPEAESLNVAMATGILIYEAVRQRL